MLEGLVQCGTVLCSLFWCCKVWCCLVQLCTFCFGTVRFCTMWYSSRIWGGCPPLAMLASPQCEAWGPLAMGSPSSILWRLKHSEVWVGSAWVMFAMFWYILSQSGLPWDGFLGIDVLLCMIYLAKYNRPWPRPETSSDVRSTFRILTTRLTRMAVWIFCASNFKTGKTQLSSITLCDFCPECLC